MNQILTNITNQILLNVYNVELYILTIYCNLRANDRFVQLIFLRIFRCIGAFIRGNGCDICWSAVICMGDSWLHA